MKNINKLATNKIIKQFNLSLFTLALSFFSTILTAEELKDQMDRAFYAFQSLQSYLVSEKKFSSKKNEDEILKLLNDLNSNFKTAKSGTNSLNKQAGFNASLEVIGDKLDDTITRFSDGKKSYALWRLKTVSQYCSSCHTTFKSDSKFVTRLAPPNDLSNIELADYYLASRQYDLAQPILIKNIYKANNPQIRISNIRKWLTVEVRVYKHPEKTIAELSKFYKQIKFTAYEKEELQDFIDSLQRWIKEGELNVPVLKKAENLIRQALGMNDPLLGKRGTVELLRATAYLHELLENAEVNTIPEERGQILYLLGLSYSRLPLFFVSELPELYLEQCIREYPGSYSAKECFRLYSNNVQVGFTGSSGTDVPKEEEEEMSELYELAYK
jgi:hypothetical protein